MGSVFVFLVLKKNQKKLLKVKKMCVNVKWKKEVYEVVE